MPTKIDYITIDFDNDNIRLEKFILQHYPIYNFIFLQKLIRTGKIRVNEKKVKTGYVLKIGDVVKIPVIIKTDLGSNNATTPSSKPLSQTAKRLVNYLYNNVLYQDDHIIAINKPPDLAVQGGKGIKVSIAAILPYLQTKLAIESELKIVHRLDKATTGVLLLAKTNTAAKHLFLQFKAQKIKKIYYCLVQGLVSQGGVIKAHILKQYNRINKNVINTEAGKIAVTQYDVLGNTQGTYLGCVNDNYCSYISFLKVYPKTGRNHQIRIHLGEVLHTPIIGDVKYGYKPLALPFTLNKDEIYLHAYNITFTTVGGKEQTITAPLNRQWLETLTTLDLEQTIKDSY